jgi:hypothetical protein
MSCIPHEQADDAFVGFFVRASNRARREHDLIFNPANGNGLPWPLFFSSFPTWH